MAIRKTIITALFIPSIALLLFTSCKKNWTCVCKVTDQNGASTELTYTFKSTSKSTAKSNCFDYDITDQSNNKTEKHDCLLK
ncbi:MAG: hypothetical protein K0S53_1519 [Bacteroidetes bacterium]|jgi:hypothetical protein|nr:hypothetical protein [Bacteroidota bacterium]MDF2452342.1 hypothetical protein [Bacteroidota bacterium]